MWLRRCKQNLLTLQATCSFVFDYSTRRLLDLLSKGTPAGGIPLGGTLTFQFCTLALGNSQVGTPGSLANSVCSRAIFPRCCQLMCLHSLSSHTQAGFQLVKIGRLPAFLA